MFRSRCITESYLNQQRKLSSATPPLPFKDRNWIIKAHYRQSFSHPLSVTLRGSQPTHHWTIKTIIIFLRLYRSMIATGSSLHIPDAFSSSICYRTRLLTKSSVSYQKNLLLLCIHRSRHSTESSQNHQDNCVLPSELSKDLKLIIAEPSRQSSYSPTPVPFKALKLIITPQSRQSSAFPLSATVQGSQLNHQ